MSDADYDDHYDDGECWQCGGEGRVAGTCIDGCCLEQDDPDCPYCSRRCDVCHPPTPEQIKSGNDLRQILAEALADTSGIREGQMSINWEMAYKGASVEIQALEEQLEKFRSAERGLSASYVRLRQLIPGALDTPTAPSPEQVWDITERALERLAEKAWMYEDLCK